MTACICRKLSDLADSQKQIITGMYPVVRSAGSAHRPGNAGYGRDSDRLSQSVTVVLSEFYKTELIQLQS